MDKEITKTNRLFGVETSTEAPSLPLSSRRTLWVFVALLVLCASYAHFEAAGIALVVAAELLALLATILWLQARRNKPWRPGRNLLLLFTFFALPYAVFLALSANIYRFPFYGPSQGAVEFIALGALLTGAVALWAGLENDGGHFIIHRAQLTLQELIKGSNFDFPPFGTLVIPKGVSQDSLVALIAPGGSWFEDDHVIKIDVLPDENFTLKGKNLEAKIELIPRDILRGLSVPIPTLDGTIKMTIPPGTRAGNKLRLKGLGLPKGKGKKRGHLYVKIQVNEDEDWQPTKFDKDTWLLTLPLLTMSIFEDFLANVGYQISNSRRRGTKLFILRFRGRIQKEMATILRHLTNINRTARRSGDGKRIGPLIIALVDDRTGEIICPFGEEFRKKIKGASRAR